MDIKYIFTYLLLVLFSNTFYAQDEYDLLNSQSDEEEHWVDSVFATLSRDDKVAQMMMIRAYSNEKASTIDGVPALLKKYKIGALCFFQGTPEKQAELTKTYQKDSEIPLLVAMDAEWGLGMRFKENAFSFPHQLTLGAIRDENRIYQMGYEIGKQLRMIGTHMNFAPVVDINTDPENPVINDRAFGDNKERVAQYGIAYMNGLHDAGVASCAKHFPGHGDTKVDSHKDLPVIPYDRQRLEEMELYPFKKLIHAGVPAIMVAHLNIPALEKRTGFASTLSPAIVTGLLKRDLNFKGLVITDAMEMQAVTKYFSAGEAEALAIMAGNDMICLPANVDAALIKILEFIDSGRIPITQVNQSVKKILRLKYRLNLHRDALPKEFTKKEISPPEAQVLNEILIKESITLAKNQDKIIPIRDISNLNTISIGFGRKNPSTFQRRLTDYARVINFTSGYYPSEKVKTNLLSQTKDMDLVIVSFHGMHNRASLKYGISSEAIDLVKKIGEKTQVIVVLFGSPYATAFFDGFKNVVVSYQDDVETQDFTAQALYGAIPMKGRLPVTSSPEYSNGSGEITSVLHRLGYSIPESVGMDSDSLKLIEKLIEKMIAEKAAPGCQVLVARRGNIVYNRSFGNFTYEGENPVLTSHMYDVASITKVAATTMSIMQLVDMGKIDPREKLGSYYRLVKGTDKADMTIEDIMAHVAGLAAWIPFYKSTLDEDGNPDPEIYHKVSSKDYKIKVAKNLWMKNSYRDSLLLRILDSKVKDPGHYRYSDLGFILLGEMINQLTGEPLNSYADENYYKPLDLRSTTFNPYNGHYTSGNIVPSEKDEYYRHQVLQGYVHDMTAADLGGVAGHAGLFSNTHDIAVLFQMLLNGGYYGGKRYLSQEVVNLFTRRVNGSSRRGIGFDMKEINPLKSLNMSELASINTFGHLGFTGCAVWADPDYDLIYIILSNRVYPTMKNKKFNRESYRSEIQSIVYRSIITGESS